MISCGLVELMPWFIVLVSFCSLVRFVMEVEELVQRVGVKLQFG